MFCPVIEIFPSVVSHFQDSNGRVILDTDSRTEVSLNKLLRAQDGSYQVEQPQNLVISIPRSPKNFFYLKDMFDPTTGKANNNYVTVRITVGSETFIHDRLYAISKSHDEIEIKAIFDADWIRTLKNISLRDLPNLGVIDFTKNTVIDKWENNSQYGDGDDGYWFPIVDYGGWRRPGILLVEDLRFHLHSTWLMQKIFEHIGWCLEFPFYEETELGRRCVDYLLREDYGQRNVALRLFNEHITYLPGNVVQLGQELLPTNKPFEGTIFLDISDTGAATILNLEIAVWKKGINPATGFIEHTRVNQADWSIVISGIPHIYHYESPVNLLPGETMYVIITSGTLTSFVCPCTIEINFSNKVDRTIYAKGDIINIANELDDSISCYDYLLGNIHICSGIVEDFPLQKRVRILTPFNADIFGDLIDGYYNNTLVELKSDQPMNTVNSKVRDTDQLRYIRLAFAKSTDELQKNRDENDNEFFAKVIDLGDEHLVDEEQNRNPLFEGTTLGIDRSIAANYTSIVINGIPVESKDFLGFYLPQMTDNDKGEVSYKIKPRKILAYGYDMQYSPQIGGAWYIRFEDELLAKLAFAAQDGSVNGILLGSDPINNPNELEQKLIYGDTTGDLWSLVWGKFFLQIRAYITLDFLLKLNPHHKYFGLDLKKLYEIEYDGHPVVGRILQVNDYRPCDVVPVQALLMPELRSDQSCIVSTPRLNCENHPTIVQEIIGTCWTFSIGGTFVCNVTGIHWEYLPNSATDWIDLGTGNTATLCDQDESFQIRATIDYDCDDCPTDVVSDTVYTCGDSVTCSLTQIFNGGQQCLQWGYQIHFANPNETGTNCEYTAELKIYQDGSLTDTIDLTLNELVCPIIFNALYVLTVTINCNNGCADLTTMCSYTGQGAPPPNQCENFPELECVAVIIGGINCYEFVIGGDNNSEPIGFIVNGSCDGVSFQWMPGDDPICCDGTITAQTIVFYCGCPNECTEVVTCETTTGCTVVDAGTAIMLAVCN